MLLLRVIPIAILLLWHASALPDDDAQLQSKILRGYNRKHRPVKVESTVTQVIVFLNIAHVEKVDEEEQTALVHGHLWASWTDEYLTWDKKATNITKLSIPSSRIWQPALALYNSARGNTWHLYMNGMPATVYYNGKVWSSGTFSFFVTCQFDFTNWPFDVQTCPIVIADWVYSLAQVNLSDPNSLAEYAKPSIRMSYDPMDNKNKRHVGGWEVLNSWKKHCYWGPQGCKETQPEGEPEWYWSLLEFGITLKRHVPYYHIQVLFPAVFTSVLVLLLFWVDHVPTAIICIFFNLSMQAVYGWTLIRQMPPGSGETPKIVNLYVITGCLTTLQLIITVFIDYLVVRVPHDFVVNLGCDFTALPKRLGLEDYFKKTELSFDPQDLAKNYGPEYIADESNGGSPLDNIGLLNPLSEPSTTDDTVLIDLPNNSDPENPDAIAHVGMDDAQRAEDPKKEQEHLLGIQLHHIKRYIFFICFFIYFFFFIYILFF